MHSAATTYLTICQDYLIIRNLREILNNKEVHLTCPSFEIFHFCHLFAVSLTENILTTHRLHNSCRFMFFLYFMGLLCCYITFANSKLLTSLCFDAEIHAHLKELPRLDVTRIVHIGKSCRTEGWQ